MSRYQRVADDMRNLADFLRHRLRSSITQRKKKEMYIGIFGFVAMFALLLAYLTSTGVFILVNFFVALGVFGGIGGFVAIASTPTDVLRARIFPKYGFISSVVFGVAAFYFSVYGLLFGRPFPVEFYSTIAQVMPVLILTTVITPQRRNQAHQVQLACYIGVGACGEFTCLVAIALGKSSDAVLFGFAAAATVGAFVGLLLKLLIDNSTT